MENGVDDQMSPRLHCDGCLVHWTSLNENVGEEWIFALKNTSKQGNFDILRQTVFFAMTLVSRTKRKN